MTAPGWDAVDAELDRWAAAGAPATFWLRDDDAVDVTPDLEALLGLAAGHRLPLALAVIPAGATPALSRRLGRTTAVSVLQHGYAHANHAVEGAKKSEYAERRPLEVMTGELVRGRAIIAAGFGGVALPVLAPPWNRIADRAIARLGACGFAGLTLFKPRPRRAAAPGVVACNAHIDLIDWRGRRDGKSAETLFGEIAAHLTARRTGAADMAEPTGLLAHHLAMDASAWTALRSVLARLAPDPRVAWPAIPSLFAAEGSTAKK